MHARKNEWGFTLVEIMIVVAVIGLLAAMAIPGFARARENARNARLANDVEVARAAFIQYSLDHGRYPPDVTPAVMPSGMSEYLARMAWRKPTAVGGSWDWDYRQFGVTAGVSVYQPAAPDTQLERFDKIVDDGDLATGMSRKRAAGYINIIE